MTERGGARPRGSGRGSARRLGAALDPDRQRRRDDPGRRDRAAGRVDRLEEEIGGLQVRITPEAFFQTNTEMAERLYGLAVEYAGLRGFERIYDLYCGIGTIGLLMAPRAAEVWGLELVEQAVADAIAAAAQNEIDNARFFAGDVRLALRELVPPPGGPMSWSSIRRAPAFPRRSCGGSSRLGRSASSTSPVIRRRWRRTPPSWCGRWLPAAQGAAGRHVPADAAHRVRRAARAVVERARGVVFESMRARTVLLTVAVLLVGGAEAGVGGHARPPALRLIACPPGHGSGDATIELRFSAPLAPLNTRRARLSPATAGAWSQPNPTTLASPRAAGTCRARSCSITVPRACRPPNGASLRRAVTATFQVGERVRCPARQLLAELRFLPVHLASSAHQPRPGDTAGQLRAIFRPPAGRSGARRRVAGGAA